MKTNQAFYIFDLQKTNAMNFLQPSTHKFIQFFGVCATVLLLGSCGKSAIEEGTPQVSDMGSVDNSQTQSAGVLTAAEWDDLENWGFWTDLLTQSNNAALETKWGFFTNNRFALVLTNSDNLPICDAKVQLLLDGRSIFSAKTNNFGRAELWANLNQSATAVDPSRLQISVNNGEAVVNNPKPFKDGSNAVSIAGTWQNDNTANISFVIDVTSSMSDELKYLKNELYDVIARIKSNNPQSRVLTSVLFYKDQGDDYVTKKLNFTEDETQSINFIKNEETSGGGDYPEAVHTALNEAVNTLNWSEKAKSRIIFLLLDAPPHNESQVIADLQKTVASAAEKGIKIIPVMASGADKDTEFAVRLFSMVTNGTFTFLTDDSKKGNTHYTPSVGTYQIEYLNNLMVRLVNNSLK